MIFALAGNQNSGKTTLFNQLTGSNQHTGNFPGVTVERKTGGIRKLKGFSVVDLPGIYSVRPFSAEEKVTCDFLLNGKPDGIINIVDAVNIERNLYLTLQLIELKIPMVLALNMMDEIQNSGTSIDVKLLSKLLGIPVIPVSAAKNEGMDELVQCIYETGKSRAQPRITDFYEGAVHRCIRSVYNIINGNPERSGIDAHFAAVKIIEGDDYITGLIPLDVSEKELIEHEILRMEEECGLDRNAAVADMRYEFIGKICRKSIAKTGESKEHRRSLRIDAVLTNRFAAFPLFLLIMAAVFRLTFDIIGTFLSDLLSCGIDAVTDAASAALRALGTGSIATSLVIDGIFTGVGSVLRFLPVIVTLFFFLSMLEDSGYMARVAFIMDRPLRKVGLSGRSFVPMLIGFGCSVPAIMSTRTLSSARDRKMTVLLTPFMSCTAKIPIYTVVTAAFFKERQAIVMALLYLIGIVSGIICAAAMNKTRFKGSPVPFVMELPNYRIPSLKTTLMLMWEKARDFIARAFTVIFLASIAIWFLRNFSAGLSLVDNSENSLLAVIGKAISPIFKPLGFSDWRISTSLIVGVTAKEAVVSTLSVLSGADIRENTAILTSLFTAKSALSFLVFTLLYTPCFAAIAAIRKELGSGVLTFFASAAQCAVAWLAAFFIVRPVLFAVFILLLCVLFTLLHVKENKANPLIKSN